MNNDYFRATQLTSISSFDMNDLNFENISENMRNNTEDIQYKNQLDSIDDTNNNNNKEKKGSFLCEECKQKLAHTENYLYNY